MDWVGIIISLISGAVGGNVAGAAMKDKSLGTAGNSIVGILGGAGVGVLLQAFGMGGGASATGGAGGSGLDIVAILKNVAGGGVGGGVLMAIVGALKATKR